MGFLSADFAFSYLISYLSSLCGRCQKLNDGAEGAGTDGASSQWCVRALSLCRGTTLVSVRFGSFHHACVDVDGG